VTPSAPRRTLFSRGSYSESTRIGELLRQETVGGALLVASAVLALVWANSPASASYAAIRDFTFGPAALHLDLTVATWAADGLLAVFFFVVGLELKREFVAGDLRDPRRAVLPVVAALGGVAVPALLYVTVLLVTGAGGLGGWAIPTATDIAFALAVLAVLSSHLPSGLRTFLLTLAVVDDLVAITIIAVFYTDSLAPAWLLGALVALGAFGLAVQRGVRTPWVLVPLAVVTWVLMHGSGVHATVAGVLLGFTVPVLSSRTGRTPGLAEHLEHSLRPLSAGVAVPVFAFFAAGVDVGGVDGLVDALEAPITLGIVAGLVVGKPLGIVLTTWLVARFTHAELDEELSWFDVVGLGMLAGIGFTVSLLIGELAFGPGTPADDHARVGVLLGSLISALLASVIVTARNRTYRRIAEAEAVDSDEDGIPDVYQQ
jgi:NhaA family Na+:H+ antiporter